MSKRKPVRKPSFISAIMSVAFVLFLLGLLAILIMQANKIFTQLKENVELSVFLEDFATDEEITALETELSLQPYIKSIDYISKEQARAQFAEEFEMSLLDENPLPSSLNLNLYADYTNTDSLQMITQSIENYETVGEVVYQSDIVELLNTNIKKIGSLLAIGSILFLLIGFSLIDSTIRLSMFSKRFLIKSMQLVGATNGFIRRPFIQNGILNGLISSLIALLMLFGVVYYLATKIQLFNFENDLQLLITIALGIILLGVLLSYFATLFSVNKYLKAKIEDLY